VPVPKEHIKIIKAELASLVKLHAKPVITVILAVVAFMDIFYILNKVGINVL